MAMLDVNTVNRNNEERVLEEEIPEAMPPPRQLSEDINGGIANNGQKTLVVYSGPTSMERDQDKNGMYIDNMDYFLEHGISCLDNVLSSSDSDDDAAPVIVNYVFVLTQEVADYYTGPNGPLTKKRLECEDIAPDSDLQRNADSNPLIKVITRLDRCYDMESIRIVITTMDVQALYDSLLFINCGLVGPKLGPGSPKLVPSPTNKQKMVPYSHWSQIYTSQLSDSVRLVGHSINTHYIYTFSPHVQSFLYTIRTETAPILLDSGAIYDCGLTQEELGNDPEKRDELINRYEVGMSTQLLKQGYEIATAFVNRYGFGRPLVYDSESRLGTEIDATVSDIWYEGGIRNLTATISTPIPKLWNSKENTYLRGPNSRSHDSGSILPWDYFVFFKVSRLVPEDVQREMHYNADELERSGVLVIPNDPHKPAARTIAYQ